MKHVSGKSRRRVEVRQRTKKRFFKGGFMVIDEIRTIDPSVWARLTPPTAEGKP